MLTPPHLDANCTAPGVCRQSSTVRGTGLEPVMTSLEGWVLAWNIPRAHPHSALQGDAPTHPEPGWSHRWESNPALSHTKRVLRLGATVAGEALQTAGAALRASVDEWGIEPQCYCLQGSAQNPSDKPVVESPGIEPGSLVCQTSVFPLDHDPL